MKARLLILIMVAGGLAIYFAAKKNREPIMDEAVAMEEGQSPEEIARIREEQTEICMRPLPGVKPPEEPDLSVTVEVDRTSGKNRLFFNITEAHGYYVETFRILVWYKPTGKPNMGSDESPLRFEKYENDYLKANETLRTCAEVVPAELSRVGGDMGTTENWDAKITWHCRAREKNPDRLPPVARATSCN